MLIYFHVQMGDRWWEAEHPCISFSCSDEGIQRDTKVCPAENCQEVLNPATTVTQYLTCDVVLTDFCDTRRTGYGIINTAALHVSPIKTCEDMFDHHWLSKGGKMIHWCYRQPELRTKADQHERHRRQL